MLREAQSKAIFEREVEDDMVIRRDPRITKSMRIHAKSVAAKGGGTFLGTAPVTRNRFNYKLDTQEFLISLRQVMGLPVYRSLPINGCPFCPLYMDRMGHHSIACSGRGSCSVRHDRTRDLLADFCAQAGIAVQKETQHLLPNARHRETGLPAALKPADLFVPYGDGGHPNVYDVTFANPSTSTAHFGAFSVDAEMNIAANHKHDLYGAHCAAENMTFYPLVFTPWGGHTVEVARFVSRIGTAIAQSSGSPKGWVIRGIWEALAISTARLQAQAIIERGEHHCLLFSQPHREAGA
jgi:hypothetical protein